MINAVVKLVGKQARKIEEGCDRASVRDSLVSTKWDERNFRLGIWSAGLAGVAAFTAGSHGLNAVTHSNPNFFESVTWTLFLTPLAALVSAILSSILTFLAPAQKAKTYHKFSNRYHSLRDRIRAFIAFRCVEGADGEALKNEFNALLAKKQEIDMDHPVVPDRYYAKAVAVIEERIIRNKRLRESKRAELLFHKLDTPQGTS